jgi:hypothetical protein
MEPKTSLHLSTALRHRDVAERLHGMAAGDPISQEWASVAAFYAAVHLVNAYIWEKLRIEPANHAERAQLLYTVADLKSAAIAFRSLQDAAYGARYVPGYRLSASAAAELLNDLATVESAVFTALPES